MISSKFSLQEKKKNVNTDNKSVVGKTQTAGTGQEERRGEEERERKKKSKQLLQPAHGSFSTLLAYQSWGLVGNNISKR